MKLSSRDRIETLFSLIFFRLSTKSTKENWFQIEKDLTIVVEIKFISMCITFCFLSNEITKKKKRRSLFSWNSNPLVIEWPIMKNGFVSWSIQSLNIRKEIKWRKKKEMNSWVDQNQERVKMKNRDKIPSIVLAPSSMKIIIFESMKRSSNVANKVLSEG